MGSGNRRLAGGISFQKIFLLKKYGISRNAATHFVKYFLIKMEITLFPAIPGPEPDHHLRLRPLPGAKERLPAGGVISERKSLNLYESVRFDLKQWQIKFKFI